MSPWNSTTGCHCGAFCRAVARLGLSLRFRRGKFRAWRPREASADLSIFTPWGAYPGRLASPRGEQPPPRHPCLKQGPCAVYPLCDCKSYQLARFYPKRGDTSRKTLIKNPPFYPPREEGLNARCRDTETRSKAGN